MSSSVKVNLVAPGHPLGSRVGVFGHGGKTSLAAAIARKAGSTHLELDEIRLRPGWRERPHGEVLAEIRARMAASPNGWVTDHQWWPAIDMIMEAADSVVVLALPFRTMFWRRIKRSLRRAWTGEPVCGGNRETFRQHLLPRDSAILEMWQKRASYRRIGETIAERARPRVDFYLVKTAGELDRFYALHGLSRS